MPGSSTFGKFSIVATVVSLARQAPVKHVLDIGPGQGTYIQLLKPYLDGAEFSCVEIWGPYVQEYNLEKQYDRVIVGDARMIDYAAIPPVDVCVAGDVLEHMSFIEGGRLVQKLLTRCDVVIGSVPAHHHPQEAHFGNPWEAHVEEDYTEQAMREHLPDMVDYIRDSYIGAAFIAAKHAPALRLQAALKEARRLIAVDQSAHDPIPDFDYATLAARLRAVLVSS